ncbi:hypothetical protein EJ08DRAFT_47276 [Tothia fuscella]|uniref:Uncharacterized protein n=1 Tax=Tothia fuscella TaxID=1048955 RepID=A0A9P4TS60_9PEZI|nr:hypothetical protein EJ08DRAFT_47276 [Tothia fuscella]
MLQLPRTLFVRYPRPRGRNAESNAGLTRFREAMKGAEGCACSEGSLKSAMVGCMRPCRARTSSRVGILDLCSWATGVLRDVAFGGENGGKLLGGVSCTTPGRCGLSFSFTISDGVGIVESAATVCRAVGGFSFGKLGSAFTNLRVSTFNFTIKDSLEFDDFGEDINFCGGSLVSGVDLTRIASTLSLTMRDFLGRRSLGCVVVAVLGKRFWLASALLSFLFLIDGL